MRADAEPIPPIYVVWRRAAKIRQGWSKQTRGNRRRKAKVLLRRIGLDESLLPPIAPHYRPADRRYRHARAVHGEPRFAYDELPPVSPGLLQRIGVRTVRSRGIEHRS